MWSRRWAVVAAGLAVLPMGVVPSAAAERPLPGVCSPRATLMAYSDALDKAEFGGHAVSGLSALGLTGGHRRALALVDNIGATPARFFDLSVRWRPGELHVETEKVTTLKRPDGTPYSGADFDGEGLVVERGGESVLASSENEPSIRRFGRADGRQTAELPVPPRFRGAPAGEAASNQTFESLAATPDGRVLYAGMEGALSADDPDLRRIIRYDGRPGGAYVPSRQYAYQADPSLGLVELVALRDGGLLALERGFTSGAGNTVRVYHASTRGARDVSGIASLTSASGAALRKRLLVDVVTCPPSGATAKQPQPNPLLDNIEGMALGPRTAGGRHTLFLISDDNGNPLQTTRVYAFAVAL
jgi:hypothetical protein